MKRLRLIDKTIIEQNCDKKDDIFSRSIGVVLKRSRIPNAEIVPVLIKAIKAQQKAIQDHEGSMSPLLHFIH